jgi:ROK family
MALTIGVDVGGTTVAAGVVDEQGGMLATVRHDTPSDDPRMTEDVIADVLRELMASHDVEAVGVGAAGFVDAQRSTVLFAPNLAWRARKAAGCRRRAVRPRRGARRSGRRRDRDRRRAGGPRRTLSPGRAARSERSLVQACGMGYGFGRRRPVLIVRQAPASGSSRGKSRELWRAVFRGLPRC